jgi:hypothetical protein
MYTTKYGAFALAILGTPTSEQRKRAVVTHASYIAMTTGPNPPALLEKGNSGSVLVDASGNAFGLVVQAINREPFARAVDLSEVFAALSLELP